MSAPQRPHIPPGVLEALKKGNKIEAIRLMRESTKLGLAETQVMVEMLEKAKGVAGAARSIAAPVKMHARAQPQPHVYTRRPGLSPGEVPREASGALGVVVLLAIGLAVAYSFVR